MTSAARNRTVVIPSQGGQGGKAENEVRDAVPGIEKRKEIREWKIGVLY